jgi:3-hydroxyacyl-[acyl-carrier-protein] dehydratase
MEVYNTHDPHFNKYALGVLVRVKQARYKGFARPGDRLRVEVKLNEMIGGIFDFSARITVDNKLITKNQFQLTNVLSSILSGKES